MNSTEDEIPKNLPYQPSYISTSLYFHHKVSHQCKHELFHQKRSRGRELKGFILPIVALGDWIGDWSTGMVLPEDLESLELLPLRPIPASLIPIDMPGTHKFFFWACSRCALFARSRPGPAIVVNSIRWAWHVWLVRHSTPPIVPSIPVWDWDGGWA